MFYASTLPSLTDETKIKMMDILRQISDEYGIPLNSIEDAEWIWYTLRYGFTIEEFHAAERIIVRDILKWLSNNADKMLIQKFKEDFKTDLEIKPNKYKINKEDLIELIKEQQKRED